MSYSIRPAAPEDLERIVEIYCADPDFLYHHIGRKQVDGDFVREDQERMREYGFLSCVVEADRGELVGVLDYRPGEEVYLCLLLVHPLFRGGAGTEICRLFEAQMRRMGSKRVRLDAVNDYEGNAVPFWEKMGYTPGEQLQLSWGEKNSGAVVMYKQL